MQEYLKEYEKKQNDALTATIKLNAATDKFLKVLNQLQEVQQ